MDNKPYVFISYAHMNKDQVLPCIQALRNSGINLWFDEGIAAGSEWPEFIAEKVVSCTKFVLFVSNAYLDSQNCKRELNFAISRKKDILSIFLEDVTLSPGMEMQLGTYQAVHKARFGNVEAFHNYLCREAFFNGCRTIPAQPAPQPAPVQPQQPAAQPVYIPRQANAQPQQPTHNASVQRPTPTGSFTGYTGGAKASAYQAAPPRPAPNPYQPQQQPNTYRPAPQQPVPYQPQQQVNSALPVKNKLIAALLAIFLGGLGVHKFYLGKIGWGIVYLVFCWTYVPAILALVEGIIMLCTSDADFCKKHKCRLENKN